MRTHDPAWEPDPNIKYNFKGKKRKLDDEEDQELAESVRTISALFQTGRDSSPVPDDAEPALASISAEIAAAIAQAQSRSFEDDDDEGAESESGQEMGGIGPNTSGIRGNNGEDSGGSREGMEDDDEDSDPFPAPLRSRKTRDLVSGTKRKR